MSATTGESTRRPSGEQTGTPSDPTECTQNQPASVRHSAGDVSRSAPANDRMPPLDRLPPPAQGRSSCDPVVGAGDVTVAGGGPVAADVALGQHVQPDRGGRGEVQPAADPPAVG